jgi:hypothetical protein
MAKQKKRNLAAMQRDIAARQAAVETGPARQSRSLIADDAEVIDCVINSDWQDTKELSRLLIARYDQRGKLTAGVALVDLGCLGIKDAFSRKFSLEIEYRTSLLDSVMSMGEMKRIDIDLAAKIVNEAIAYARSLGFEPHHEFKQFEPLLAGANPDAATEDIPLGADGKPFYSAGPNDNTRNILATLDRAVGPGNYEYVVFS